MIAELNKEGKIMMCEACDHVFHFPTASGSVCDCPSCSVTLYRANSYDFIATEHIYGSRNDVPLLAEVIRPKFEQRLRFSESTHKSSRKISSKATSVKVCETCYSIRDVIDGEDDSACPACFPSETSSTDSTSEVTSKQTPVKEREEVEYVAIDIKEAEEERADPAEKADTVLPEREVVLPQQREEQAAVLPKKEVAISTPHPKPVYSMSTATLSPHIDFYEGAESAPIFKKSNTELAHAYEQIKLPKITGALVEHDTWSNFKKQTPLSVVTDKLNFTYVSGKKVQKNEDIFLYQVRQVVKRYTLLALCIVGTVGVISWSFLNSF